jgi:hypothetical protein
LKPGEFKKDAEKQLQSSTHALWFTRGNLSKAFALGGCVICHAVHAGERKGIHSFLREGMMFPHVRQKFLDGGAFCLRHFCMAKEIEDMSWQTGGFGLALAFLPGVEKDSMTVLQTGSVQRSHHS